MPEEKLLNQAAPGQKTKESAKNPDGCDDTSRRGLAERRNSMRQAVSASAELIESRSRTRLAGRATDLSPGGCYVDTVSPFPVGTTVHLRLTSEGRMVQAQARVLYATSGMGMGLAFTNVDSKSAAILADWLRELSDEQIPAPGVDNEAFYDSRAQGKPQAANSLHQIVEELLSLLARKHLLTESEARDLQKKLSDAPT